MTAAILVIVVACAIFWLVFFKLKLLRLTPGWAIIFSFFVLHLFLVFLIGLRFVTPNSTNATVVQRTIQLVPRLPDPTPVTAVLVEEGVSVKKGQPLFQFDRRPYEYQVEQLEAQLAAARQNVLVLKANVDMATQSVAMLRSEFDYELYQKGIFDRLAKEGAVREEDIEKWQSRVTTARAALNQAIAGLDVARLTYESQIGGTNTTVANVEAQLRQARYYLGHTTMTAPEDGRIINLQVRPGMVSGIYRIGRDRGLDCGRRSLCARDLLPGKSQIRETRAARRGRARPLPRPDLPRQSRQHLARQRGGAIPAER
jgi:multidrug resistance efflux pump